MKIEVDYKTFRHITNKSESPALTRDEALNRHDYFLMRQTILCLAGKECNSKIKKMIESEV